MHIIQIWTIGAWKGAQERSGKPCSCYLVHSHAFYKEWANISRKCVGIVNHKRVAYWVNNYTKMKYMLGKHDAWCGAMVWPHRALVKMSSCTPFIKRTITKEVSWFRGGNHQDWRGIQISFVLCPRVFFYDEHTTCKSLCSNLAFFRAHLPYLGDYVHFLGINGHNSNSNNRCMKRCTRTVWKTMLMLFGTFSCLLQGMGRYFKEMCGNSQP